MGRRRMHNAELPSGVHVIKKPNNRTLYYWRPGRGTDSAGISVRLPDDSQSPKFWEELNRLRAPTEKDGGVSRMIDAYIASPHYGQLRPATRREYDRYMRECKAMLGHFDPNSIMPSHIAAIRDQNGDTPAKANAIIRAIAALYAWGREAGHAIGNPANGIKKLKIGEWQPWPEWALRIAEKHLRDELRIACLLALYTGQRLGDVLEMKLSDVRKGSVRVKQSKTGKVMIVPLHTEALPLVEECKARSAFYLVSMKDGNPLTPETFQAMWTREMQRHPHGNIRRRDFNFHGLRKNAANKLAEAGCSEKEIGAVTGMSPAMVAHYTKGADQIRLARQAMAKVEST